MEDNIEHRSFWEEPITVINEFELEEIKPFIEIGDKVLYKG